MCIRDSGSAPKIFGYRFCLVSRSYVCYCAPIQWLEWKLRNRSDSGFREQSVISGRWPLDPYRRGKAPAYERAARIASPVEDTPAMHCMVARGIAGFPYTCQTCLLYTYDAADEEDSVDLGGRRIIKKK